jgi:hypothetical protein
MEATYTWEMLATLHISTWCKDTSAEPTSTMNNHKKIKSAI